ncbi:heme ABC transporter ATP-binding protein [uncultured Cohaesibacter sp.]|uniref:heme ABC transporter ATP-binding protein n=1 Tax=uncultured Cohaesibacter sp. TaxID=1002546 RepID=UPI0029C8A84A|nr:heme ABC transporter ATP-binding protein [uncultured Cohaesibacter sp.]
MTDPVTAANLSASPQQTSSAFCVQSASLMLGKHSVLHSLSLSLPAAELTVIIGPNGAGKSTFLKLLAGDHRPSAGTVTFEGKPLSSLKASQMAPRRAVMAQSSHLSFPFTVLEVVRLGAEVSAKGPDAVARRAFDALEKVDMGHHAGSAYQDLSGGEQQRVQLARTLAQVWEPTGAEGANFLFLDEPISNLDIRHQVDIMEQARRYADAGGGCIAVLHDLNIAAMFAHRLLVFKQGSIIADGPPHRTLTDGLMEDVFDIPIRVNARPLKPSTYILPQSLDRPQP